MTDPAVAARRAAAWRSLPLAPILALVLGLAVLAWAVMAILADWRLSRHGVWAEARVTAHDSTPWRAGEMQRHRLSYAFEVQGQQVTGQVRVSRAFLDRAPVGARIAVRHDPQTPRLHAVAGAGSVVPVLVALAAGLGGVIGGLWLGGPPLRALPSRLRAAAGAPRAARVVGQVHLPGGRFAAPRLRIRWQDSEGGQGESGPLPPLRAPGPGAAITLRVDPRTGRGWWEGEGQGGAPPPRFVTPRAGALRGWGLAFGLMAALAGWASLSDRRAHDRLVAQGVQVQATVLARWMDDGGDWRLLYAFAPAGAPTDSGAIVQGQGTVPRIIAPGLSADPHRPRSRIAVRHLPADPARNQPAETPRPPADRRLVVAAIGLGVVGLSLFVFGIDTVRGPQPAAPPPTRPTGPAWRWLALAAGLSAGAGGLWWLAGAEGRAARAFHAPMVEGLGTVTDRSLSSRLTGGRNPRTGSTLSSVLVYHLAYEFEPLPGQVQRGESRVFGVEHDRLPPGARVLVRHMPGDPGRHVLALAAPPLRNWVLDSLAVILACGAVIGVIAGLAGGGAQGGSAGGAAGGAAGDRTTRGVDQT
jgi:hypothetical protein